MGRRGLGKYPGGSHCHVLCFFRCGCAASGTWAVSSGLQYLFIDGDDHVGELGFAINGSAEVYVARENEVSIRFRIIYLRLSLTSYFGLSKLHRSENVVESTMSLLRCGFLVQRCSKGYLLEK